jgi:SAM-dependent methyltransferase
MQITPLLERLCGYREVRGAYYGKPGDVDRKIIRFPDGEFRCSIDHFDAERDPFPYPDEYFDLVIAGEIIEHMIFDPMHLLLESRRVLIEGGRILITTPNIASLTSLAKVLTGEANPQIYSLYKRPGGELEIGHMREYTAAELAETMKAAGFEVERLFTTFLDEYDSHRPLLSLLEANGYSTENRGQQTWCVARKQGDLPIDRYPFFLYDP